MIESGFLINKKQESTIALLTNDTGTVICVPILSER